MKPFLKWAGNKYAIIGRVRSMLPRGRRLVEPFAGSCAVFLNTDYSEALIADRNADLISLYNILKTEGSPFIEYCQTLFTPENNQEAVYYMLREDFNHTQDERYKAALFLYFNRHGYNGLCRYNAKGIFNVPFGRYLKPYFPAREMQAFYVKAQRAEFRVADFRVIMKSARAGDVVYCDPPYVPLSPTSNFVGYHTYGFGALEQQALAHMAETLAARGIPVVISNHDTEFTHKAYQKARCENFLVQRFISSNGSNRTKAKELLALFEAA